jgi:hypothetical protein
MNISVLVHIQQIYPQQQKKKKKKPTSVYINMCVCKSFHKSIFHREPEYINDAKRKQMKEKITNASQKKTENEKLTPMKKKKKKRTEEEKKFFVKVYNTLVYMCMCVCL